MPDILLWIALAGVMVTLFSRRGAGCCAATRFGSMGPRGALGHGGSGRSPTGRGAFERGGHPQIGGALDPPARWAGNRQASYAGWYDERRRPSAPAERPLSREEKEARLRARYVSGEITVEEYEQGLDELYRRM